MTAPTVFISYSHDSSEHNERVLQFSNKLRSHGIDAELDRYHVRPPKGWPHWCEEQLRPENSEFVLMICTETYLKRVQDKVPADEGRGVFWEGSIIYDYIYDAKGNTRFIPVLFPGSTPGNIPTPIRNHTRYEVEEFELTDVGYQALYRELTSQPLVEKPPLGDVIEFEKVLEVTATPLVARQVKTDFAPIETEKEEFKADISRIDKYAPAELVGREEELKLLNDAWNKVVSDEKPRPHILTFVALGGEGKTSVVAKWAAEMAHQESRRCQTVFAWSFYSQGSRETAQESSDIFLAEALRFFGDEETAASAKRGFDKAKRLAQILADKRALLILDGIEPLQYAPGPPMDSRLKDDGLAALVKALATTSDGLCVVTTRYSILDLKLFWQTTAPERELLRLSPGAGVHLLKTLGVKGTHKEFETLVADVKGHALTLDLLGTYLRDAHNGDIRKRDLVKLEEADAEEQSGHAFRVMDAYVTSFKNGGENGKRVLAVLRLLGLFDRPATADCLNALWTGDEIGGLTGPLINMSDAHRNITLKRLQDANLITVNREAGSGRLISLDAHSLVREYFASRVREQFPGAWRAAHRRLYEYLRNTTKEGEASTLEDLQPLYQAVAHGCQAGLQQETYQLYYRRIHRERAYGTKNLGAFGSDLRAVACFFESPWSQLSPNLSQGEKSLLLMSAAFNLRALGRLTEALQPMRAVMERDENERSWPHAAQAADNLSETELTLGEIADAVLYAKKAVTFSDRSGDAYERMISRTTLADALHQAGGWPDAERCFREAEQIQAKSQRVYPLLYSVSGFQYCDLLLGSAERAAWQIMLGSLDNRHDPVALNSCRAVRERATRTFKWATEGGAGLLTIALDQLTIGRAELYSSILEGNGDVRDPQENVTQETIVTPDTAVSSLRQAGQLDDLPRGLLTRAWLRFVKDNTGALSANLDQSFADLDEAWEIAERGPMRLFMADIHLYRARLFHAVKPYPWNKFEDGREGRGPKNDLADARKLIEKCGYWRRKEELEDAEEAAKNWD